MQQIVNFYRLFLFSHLSSTSFCDQPFCHLWLPGLSSQSSTLHQDYCTISVSAPSFSVSTDRSESPAKTNEYQIQRGEVNRQVNEVIHGHESPTKKNQLHIQHGEVSRQSKKANHGRNVNPALLSPGSASTPRRSTRIKVNLILYSCIWFCVFLQK